MKSLLVGSVFATSSRNPVWFNLQSYFLQKTTYNYDHVIFLNGKINPKLISPPAKILGINRGKRKKIRYNHSIGLNAILKHYYNSNYNNLLILDSDAFPIKQNWQGLLTESMSKISMNIAAPIRFENLDTFPHPCALFIIGKPKINIFPGESINLLGQKVKDVGGNITSRIFPLLRTNVHNPHPLIGAIYYHMFYHHGCGSRNLKTRSTHSGYYNHINIDHVNKEQQIFDNLVSRKEMYIQKLCGQMPLL